MLEIIFTLVMLILLQAVLGFDNLLYISLESKKAPEADQKKVRKNGILIAIVLRIVLLFVLVSIKWRVQAACRFFGQAIKGLEALFCTKRSRAHETFLQTCFVGVSCGCRSTCLHEMQPRHNLLRHGTNDK